MSRARRAPLAAGVLEREHTAQAVAALQRCMREELQQEISSFQAGFLLDVAAEQIGAPFYNRGLHDARQLLAGKLDELDDALYQLEQPVQGRD